MATITPEFKAVMETHWLVFEAKIMARAKELAKDAGLDVTQALVGQAACEFAPGYPSGKRTWRDTAGAVAGRYGVTIVSALLTIVFGGFALFGTGKIAANSASFLDIAKIFAGAVVGSTAGAAAVGASRRLGSGAS